MLVAWMAYAVVVAAGVAGAALLLEHGAREAGLSLRWVWVGGLLAALAIPSAAWIGGAGDDAAPSAASSAPIGDSRPAPTLPGFVPSPIPPEAVPALDRWEPWLLRGWAAGSALLAAVLLGSAAGLHRARGRWRRSVVDGEPVWISRDVGPAVVGLVHPSAVVPGWVLELAPAQRTLILRHEREHIRAGDAWVLLLAVLPVVLLPWNPALWWMVRRLRHAMEMDCDARVVGGATPGLRHRYGRLLLEVARRAGPGRRAPVAAFSEERSGLGRRVRRLASPGAGSPVRSLLAVGAGVLVVGLACTVSEPVAPLLEEEPPTALSEGPVFTPYTVAPRVVNTEEVVQALDDGYPPLLRDAGIGGTATVYFFIDETGRVVTTRLNQGSGHADLDAAALGVAEVMEFTPARNRDRAVPVWVSFPITFQVR